MISLPQPGVDPTRRLLAATSLALLLHAAVIAAVRFELSSLEPVQVERLSVSFSQVSNRQRPDARAPEAAADHLGGGSQSEQLPRAIEPAAVAPTPAREPELLAAPSQPSARVARVPETTTTLTVRTAPAATTAPEPQPQVAPAPSPALSASALMSQARRLARLSTSLPEVMAPSDRGTSPERSGLSTRFSVAEAYVDSWVRKVEDWGTRNFPDEARRQRLTGSLTLNVVLRYDGSIHEITLLRSSGHQALDDAAFRIVHLAAPFAPFPAELREQQGDFFSIKRTWQFLQGSRLSSG